MTKKATKTSPAPAKKSDWSACVATTITEIPEGYDTIEEIARQLRACRSTADRAVRRLVQEGRADVKTVRLGRSNVRVYRLVEK